MTEEIIIDGVDVSECCFYNNGKCDNPNGMACNCINNAVCYFKELKRLEFELKVTKADYEASEQENKTLNYQWQKQSEISDEWYKIAEKYKMALEEIRNYCNRIEQGYVIGTQDCLINSIKNITNEVLND